MSHVIALAALREWEIVQLNLWFTLVESHPMCRSTPMVIGSAEPKGPSEQYLMELEQMRREVEREDIVETCTNCHGWGLLRTNSRSRRQLCPVCKGKGHQ